MPLLQERYLSLFDLESRKQFLDVVWDMMELSYRNIGGNMSFLNKEELLNDSFMWKLVRKDGNIVACVIYKQKHPSTRKTVSIGNDGSDVGKQSVLKVLLEDIKMKRSYAEVSEAVEHILVNKHGAEKIPNKYASQILNKHILSLDEDGYHYQRYIGGEKKTKVLIGNVEEIIGTMKNNLNVDIDYI